MRKVLSLIALVALFNSMAAATTEGDRAKLEDRLDDAARIVNEIMAAPDKGIPEEILDSAECVAVIPSMLKAGSVPRQSRSRRTSSCLTLAPAAVKSILVRLQTSKPCMTRWYWVLATTWPSAAFGKRL